MNLHEFGSFIIAFIVIMLMLFFVWCDFVIDCNIKNTKLFILCVIVSFIISGIVNLIIRIC